MDIKSISTLSLPQTGNLVAATQAKAAASAAAKTQTPPITPAAQMQIVEKEETKQDSSKKLQKNLKKALPYVAGAVVLAGLGVYLVKRPTFNKKKLADAADKIDDQIKKTAEEIKNAENEAANTSNKAKTTVEEAAEKTGAKKAEAQAAQTETKPAVEAEKVEAPKAESQKPEVNTQAAEETPKTENIQNNTPEQKTTKKKNSKSKTAKTKTNAETTAQAEPPKADSTKAQQPKTETPAEPPKAEKAAEQKAAAAQAQKTETKTTEDIIKSIKLDNKELVEKISANKKDKADEINRIIGENTKDGHINFDMMKKIANDFMSDLEGRGDNRYHQAADILEQSYIREFIKTDGNTKSGLNTLYEKMMADEKLSTAYQKLSLEEVACRLDSLRKNELATCKAANEMTPDEFFTKALEQIAKSHTA